MKPYKTFEFVIGALTLSFGMHFVAYTLSMAFGRPLMMHQAISGIALVVTLLCKLWLIRHKQLVEAHRIMVGMDRRRSDAPATWSTWWYAP